MEALGVASAWIEAEEVRMLILLIAEVPTTNQRIRPRRKQGWRCWVAKHVPAVEMVERPGSKVERKRLNGVCDVLQTGRMLEEAPCEYSKVCAMRQHRQVLLERKN